MAHVILRDITKRFGSVVAVDKLNLEIERGECISFLGPSGCGKTTTLRMLAGFEDLDEGEILVGDRVISSRFKNYYLPPEKRDFGMVHRSGPKKFEAGTQSLLGLVGLNQAIEFILEVGVDRIAHELLRKRNWLVPALQAKGYTVLHAEAPAENASGIVTFFKPGVDLSRLHEKLLAANVVTSLRVDRAGNVTSVFRRISTTQMWNCSG